MSQLTPQNSLVMKSPQLQAQNSGKMSVKLNGSQVSSKEFSLNQSGTPMSLPSHKRKTSTTFEKGEGGSNTPQSQQQSQTLMQSSVTQKEERQQTQIQKMMQQYKGQNYKLGDTSPICILKVRPLFIHEVLQYNKHMIEVLDKEALVFHSTTAGDEEITKDFLLNLTKDKIYRAHRMIPHDQSNSALYGLEFPQIIDNLLKGISHSLLAIGAKDSGKTHSLFGTLSDPGLLLYFVQSLFTRKSQSGSIINIYMSVMKYDNDFSDLLCPTDEPLLFKQGRHGNYMPSITRVKIESIVEFFIYFRLALRSLQGRDINRDFQIGSGPSANQERNHCVFRFQIFHKIFEKQYTKQKTMNQNTMNQNAIPKDHNQKHPEQQFEKIEQKIYESEMVFIDCDHYDINDKIDYRQILQSMITIENIFQYVYEINKGIRTPQTHIPYDNSKFTHYFKNYLFGNNQLIFFGALSPYRNHLDESMKTARMAQWAFYSKNCIQPRVTVGIPAWQKETIFIRKISHQTNVLGDEVKGYISDQYMKSDDKALYLQNILNILKDIKHVIAKNAKMVRNFLGLREDLTQLKTEYLKLEYNQAKLIVRCSEIRELYLVRALPSLKGDLAKQLKHQQQTISKSISEINYYFLQFGQIRQKIKEVVETQNQCYKNILKGSHLDALYQLGLGAIEYVKWSQENAIRSYEAHESYRMDMWMDEMTTKVFTFIEHLISQMDIKEVYQKKRVRTYKKIPTQIALRSLKSMSVIAQNDLQITNLNKIILEEEKKGNSFGTESIKNDDLPSIAAHHKRNHSFQFQRSPISGKYSPQVSQKHILTPTKLDKKTQEQKSSVLDAFHTFLNLEDANSSPNNNANPNEGNKNQNQLVNQNGSLPEFQNNFNTRASINQILNPKSLFFSNQNNKSTFNYFEENNSLEQINHDSQGSIEIDPNTVEGKQNFNNDKNAKSNGNQIVIINEEQEQQDTTEYRKQPVKSLLKKTSIEQVDNVGILPKRKANATSFELIQSDKRIETASVSVHSRQSKETSNRDIQIDSGDYLLSESVIVSAKGKSKKYSMDDLQRIDQELKQKRALIKEEKKYIQKLAYDEDKLRLQEQNNQLLQNLALQTKNQQYLNQKTPSANFQRESASVNQSTNLGQRNSFNIINQKDLNSSANPNQTSFMHIKDSSFFNIRENSQQHLNVNNIEQRGSFQSQPQFSQSQMNTSHTQHIQQAQSENYQAQINNLQQQYQSNNQVSGRSLLNMQMPVNSFRLENHFKSAQHANKNNVAFLSPQKITTTAEDRFLNIINYKSENPNFQNKNIFKNNMMENKYYLQNPSIKKKAPFLKMEIHKNDIKIKSKIQLDDQKVNSSYDNIESKSVVEGSKNNLHTLGSSNYISGTFNKIQNPSSLNRKGNSMSHKFLHYNQQQNTLQSNELNQMISKSKAKLNGSHLITDLSQLPSPLPLQNNKLNSAGLLTSDSNHLLSPKNTKLYKGKLNQSHGLIEQDLQQMAARAFNSSQIKINTENIDQQTMTNSQNKVKLPSIHINSLQQLNTNNNNEKSSSSNIQSKNILRSESEKKFAKMGHINTQFNNQQQQLTQFKSPIDINSLSYLQRKNRQQQENLKQILFCNINNNNLSNK